MTIPEIFAQTERQLSDALTYMGYVGLYGGIVLLLLIGALSLFVQISMRRVIPLLAGAAIFVLFGGLELWLPPDAKRMLHATMAAGFFPLWLAYAIYRLIFRLFRKAPSK